MVALLFVKITEKVELRDFHLSRVLKMVIYWNVWKLATNAHFQLSISKIINARLKTTGAWCYTSIKYIF